MKKKMGRPKIGTENAKDRVFAARFTPAEAHLIENTIAKVGVGKSEWVRNALLSSAKAAIPAS